MNYKIDRVVSSTTITITPNWKKGDFEGNRLRIAGVRTFLDPFGKDLAAQDLRVALEGKRVSIISMYYVESGNTLVAQIDVEGQNLGTLFQNRFDIPLPRIRMMELGDTKTIRAIEGGRDSIWSNPLRMLDLTRRPCIGGFPYPVPGDPEFKANPHTLGNLTEKANAIYSTARVNRVEDDKAIDDFLGKREEKMLVLFGDGGIGKSWFVRHYLRKNPPPDMDVAFIDVINYPRNSPEHFQARLDDELSQILAGYVDARPGGLRNALRFHFENLAKGIFPELQYDDAPVRKWVQDRLTEYSSIAQIHRLNELRLKSYAHNQRDLLIVIDNLDAFNQTEQDTLIEDIVKPAISGLRIFMIVSLRRTSMYFNKKLGAALTRIPREHELSQLDMREMIRKRFLMSETLVRIADNPLDNDSTLTFGKLFDDIYATSAAEQLITELCQGDARHYIRLFRRHIFSNKLNDFRNVGKEYFCISTLMFWGENKFDNETTFILNFFDNGHPSEIGNALIRWRVFEFFEIFGEHGCSRKDDFFCYYFQRLGYNLQRVEEILDVFREAGILELYETRGQVSGKLTNCGKRYSHLVESLWYCIVIKTGMNMYEDLILKGVDAQKEAEKMGVSIPRGKEWVSDENFLAFIQAEEEAEQAQVLANVSITQEFERNILQVRARPIAFRLAEAYYYQQKGWEKRRALIQREV